MREIIFDTETTGLDPLKGDRLVEIGCIETIDYIPTGRTFHTYLNPDRNVHPDAMRIHGLTDEFLKDKPRFLDIIDNFLEFLADSPLVAHNASFDMGFINAELTRASFDKIPNSRVIDTLPLARKKYPGQQNSLDALCSRLNIDTKHRTKHGALLDADLLALVYLELRGGRQRMMDMSVEVTTITINEDILQRQTTKNTYKTVSLSELEQKDHNAAQKIIGDKAIWAHYK